MMSEQFIKPLGIEINWKLAWSNEPDIHLWIEESPKFIYSPQTSPTSLDHTLWYAEDRGMVSFFYDRGSFVNCEYYSKQEDGFGGRHIELQSRVGPVTLKGPWSSRASVLNNYHTMARQNHCIEIAYTTKQEVFEKGFTYYGGACTVEFLRYVLENSFPNLELQAILRPEDGPRYFLPKSQCGKTSKEIEAASITNIPYTWKRKIEWIK